MGWIGRIFTTKQVGLGMGLYLGVEVQDVNKCYFLLGAKVSFFGGITTGDIIFPS